MTAPAGGPTHPGGLGPTRVRDLAVVLVVAVVAAYGLTRFNYSAIPRLPRFAGVTAAALGIGEAVWGAGLRRRIQAWAAARRDDGSGARSASYRPPPSPVMPLTAARALAVAKASALAGAALAGLWIGFGAYVVPQAGRATAPAADAVTALVGVIGAVVLLAGALWLEFCCRAPDSGRSDSRR